MVNYWLVKQEPNGPRAYSFDAMRRDGRTVWDGVRNNLALKHMNCMRRKDLAFFYHTGGERQVVGVVEVASDPYPDPEGDDGRFVVVDVRYKKRLKNPVTLEQMKGDPEFRNWELLRISRLSVMPVPPAIWKRILKMSEG